jgi:hypothetical protein
MRNLNISHRDSPRSQATRLSHCKSASGFEHQAVEKKEVIKGTRVRFVGSGGPAPLTAEPSQHLLTDCGGEIVMGPSEDVWCYPDSPELDMVWVAFADDIRPICQVSAAWLETA